MKTGAQPPGAARKRLTTEQRQRQRGLTPAHAEALRRAMRLMASGDRLLSGQLLLTLSEQVPDHPEVLRWCGVRHAGLGEWSEAVDCLARAAAQHPDDFEVWSLLGTAQDHTGDCSAARQSLRAAARCASDPQQWLALSLEFDRQGYYEDSLDSVEHAIRLAPDAPVNLLQRSRCFKALGQAQQAAADCRALIDSDQLTARAWFSLVDLKTVPLGGAELKALEHAAAAPPAVSADRLLLDFALGKALEDDGQFEKAVAVFERANGAAQAAHPWDLHDFAGRVAAVRAAFIGKPPASARPQGGEVIFLVGLPRSGTTLVEQVLASHSTVEGASELPYLNQVVEAESRRRGQPFPAWVGTSSADDWTRLGQHYLRLSARWRTTKPRSTDKLPENWLLAGAALAMLPEARVIDCRRDPLETCWSCFKQLFGPGRAGFAYDFASLAAYWREYDQLCEWWTKLYPTQFQVQPYEALVADPERQIRALLAFCGLPFEAGCLHSHTTQRAIRTPSALQVRQPMHRVSTPAARYGSLLDRLRRLLLVAPQA